MTTYNPPKKNAAFIMYVALEDQANAGLFKASPTLAAGDFKVSLDGGSLTNLATLPTNTPAASTMVKISLSAAEMNADNVTVVCSDGSGAEWYDLVINLQTAANQFDDLPTNAEVNTEVDTALTDIGLDHLVAASVDGTDITDNSIIAKMASKQATADWDSFVNTTDSLQAIRDNHASPGTIADSVLDELLSGHTTAGSLGKAAADILADTNSLNDGTLSEITGAADIPATPTIAQAIALLYMAIRNNTQVTATERRILNDAGTEVLDATISDDGTTFQQGKLGDA